MAKYSNTVEYNIRTTLDSSGISRLQAQLTQLQNQVKSFGANGMINPSAVNKTLADIKKVQQALNQAFNPKLGMFNSSTFLSSLNKAGLSLNKLNQDWSKLGATGQQAFNSMYGQIAKIDTGMRSVSNTTDKIMNTLGNTVRWGLIASGFAAIMNSVHQAAKYVSDLDKSLTNIMMVSGEARDTMNEFAKSANQVAQRLGGTTVQMTEATKVFIQQGLSLQESQKMGEYAVHLANVSEQDSATASDEITAYRNAFKINLDDMGNAISKWAAVANNAAVSVEELSVASQKAASVAATVGVDLDQFAGHIAAIESVTREAPENIGNGLKTIYSRIADISLGETLEDGVNLGSFAKALNKVGVEVLDSTGQLRDAGDILEDTMKVWQDLNQTQRAAVAKTVAGRFQLARFEALMNRADIYENAANISRAETGTETYDRMQETYRNSLEGRSKALQASVEEIFLNIFTTDSFYGAVDALQKFVDTINNLVEAVGGGEAALTGLVVIMTKLASNSLSRGISNFITNRQADIAAKQNVQSAQQMAASQLLGQGLRTNDQRLQTIANQTAAVNQYAPIMNEEQIRRSNELLNQRIGVINDLTAVEERHQTAETQLRTAIAAVSPGLKLTSEELIKQIREWEMAGVEVSTASKKFEEIRALFFNTGSAVSQFTEKLTFFADQGLTDVEILEQMQREARILAPALEGVAKAGGLTAEQLERLTAAQEILKGVANGTISSEEKLREVLDKLGVTLIEVNSGLSIVPKKLEQIRKEFGVTAAQATQLSAADKELAGAQQMLSNSLHLQNLTNQFIGLANSALTGVFALQSFKGLIEVINNEDLTIAEKFEQFNMNLAMVAALGIPAIAQFKTAIAGVSEALIGINVATKQTAIANALLNTTWANGGDLASARMKAIYDNLIAQKALNKENIIAAIDEEFKDEVYKKHLITLVEEKFATEGTAGAGLKEVAIKGMQTLATNVLTIALGKEAAQRKINNLSITTLVGAYAAVALAITTVIAIVNALSKAEEERKAALQANIDASNKITDSVRENNENLEKLNNTYIKTGVATNEFREALLKQGEALGITDTKLLIATGRYNDLKEKIDAAAEAQLRYNNILLQEQNRNLSAKSDISINDDNTSRLLAQAGVNYSESTISEDGGATTTSMVADDGYTKLLKFEQTSNELIKANKDLTDQIAQKTINIEELRAKGLKDQVAVAEKDLEKLKQEKAQNEKDIQWYQKELNSENGQKILANGQQIVDNNIILAQTDKAFQYTEGQTIDDFKNQIGEQLKARGEQVSDEILDKYVQGIASGETESAKKLAEQVGYEQAKETFTQQASNLIQQNVDIGDIDAADADQYVQNIVNAIDSQSISAGDKAKLFNWIDWDGTQAEIDEQLNAILNNFQAEHPLNVDQFLTRQGAQGFSIQEQVQALSTDDLDDDIKNLADVYKTLTEGIAEAGSEMEGFSDDLKDNVKDSAKAASAILRYDSALERAAKSMDEWKSMLESSAFEDHAAAGAELRDIYSDILDLSGDMDLSLDFTADPENLELLQRVMQGDIDAYDELADRAQANIEIQAGIDTAQAEADVASINSMLDELGYEDIPIGVHIESDALEEELNGIIAAAGMTAQQAESLLASMGLEAELETAEEEKDTSQTVTNWNTRLEPVTDTAMLPTPDGESKPSTVKSFSVITEPSTVTVPGTAKGAAFGLNVTGTSTGKSSGGGVKIKHGSVKKATSGGAKYNNASHGGGSKKGSGGSGGGGGGGGSQAKKVKAPESAKSNFDPYEKNNAQLSKNEDLLTRIDKTKSRSSGAKWLNMIEDENKALQDQNKILEDRLKINEAEAEALRTGKDNSEYGIYLHGESLAKYGLTDADLDGIVENGLEKYNAALAKQRAAEAAVKAYFEAHGGVMDENGKTITEAEMGEEEEEEFNKLVEAAKEAAEYANGMDGVIQKYNKVSDEIRDNTEKTQENLEKMEDNMIEIYRQTKNAADSLKEMREDAVDTEEALGTLFGDNAAVSLNASQKRLKLLTEGVNPEQLNKAIKKLQDKLANTTDEALQRTYKTQIAALERAAKNGTSVLDLNAQRLAYLMEQLRQYEETGEASDYGKNIAALMEDIEDARKDGVEFAKEMKDRIEEVHQGIQNCLDEIYDAYDAVSAIFDYADDQLDYLGSMTEILYGDKAYAEMEKIARLQAKSGEERLKTLQKTREENHLVLLGLQEGTEEYKKALEKEQELDKQILDTRVNIAESYKTAKENANELAIQDWLSHFQVEVQGTMVPLEYGIDAWERIKENADNYLDDLNRAWETEKLQLKYQQLLNEATDPNIQRQITDQMKEQLDYLREKNNLSKYDVDYANAQLEILQKTIALEDAREAKNQMKLRRDSQGNYSYVYTADQNDIAEKRNELLDAQMNGYNMSVEASVNAQDAFLNKVQNMADQLRTAANDMSITDEQRQAILQDIIQQGYDFLAAQTEQLDTAQVNTIESFIAAAQQLAEENAGAVTQIADELTLRGKDAMELMNTTMQNVIGKMITKDEEDNNIPAFRDELIGAVQEIINNVGLFEQAMTEANYNIQDPLSSISDKFTGVSETLNQAKESAKGFYEYMKDTSGIIANSAKDLSIYQAAMTDMNSEMNAYYTSWRDMGTELETERSTNAYLRIQVGDLEKERDDAQQRADEAERKLKGGSGKDGNGLNGNTSDSDTAWHIAQNIWTYGSWGNDPHRHDRITERYGEAIADLTQQYINDYWASGDLVNWASDIWGYATGGYTGSWADSENGRLALLHQKELVLNADDTENILAAVDLVRSFVDSLKAISTPSFGQNYSASTNNIGDTIEQRVQITAEFPGVQSSVEIEQALLNLANNAYQHAYNQNYKTI